MLILKYFLALASILYAVDAVEMGFTKVMMAGRKGGKDCGDHKENEFYPCGDGCNFCSCFKQQEWKTEKKCKHEKGEGQACEGGRKDGDEWPCKNPCKTKCFCQDGQIYSSKPCYIKKQ